MLLQKYFHVTIYQNIGRLKLVYKIEQVYRKLQWDFS